MANMTTVDVLQGIHDWVIGKIDEETANFITKTVNDLVNYYTKSETYTKAEVQQIVDTIKQFKYEVVQVLPTASASTMNKIYLVPAPKSEDKNVKEEYITIQNGSTYSWEMLGTTSIDLSNYYTKGQTDSAISAALTSALQDYTTTDDLMALLDTKANIDGFYEQMVVGEALALVSQTQRTNDAMYRKSGGIEEVVTGAAEITNIKGKTVAWNQLLNEGKLVDMGLPSGTLWASCNIDITQPDGFAASPFQYECSFFSWGNVDGHNPVSISAFDYNWGGINAEEPWYDGQVYSETQGNTFTGNIPVGDTYDAARVDVGTLWRMPTNAEYGELFANIIYIDANGDEVDTTKTDKRVDVNGVKGLYLESTINGARLFFSCSGYGDGRTWYNRGSYGSYWSSTWSSARNARSLYFYSGGVKPQNYNNRYSGFAVRSVITKSELIGDGKNGHKYALSSNNANITDVTLAYGSNNEPSTVAQFEADYFKWFGKLLTYEEYDAGSLRSVQLESLKTTGFNQYNNGIAKVIGDLQYQITGTYTSITLGEETITPDANGLFTPSTTGTLTIVGGGSDTCVHISGDRNGTYEPYEEHVAPIPVTTLKGKLNGEGESVVVFPDGMKSVGTIADEIYTVGDNTYAVKRVGSVDLGSLNYVVMSTNNCFRSGKINDAPYTTTNAIISNGSICRRITEWTQFLSYTNTFSITTQYFGHSYDGRYNGKTAEEIKTAMSGEMLYYELAEPLVYEVEGFTLPKTYLVDGGGTEEQVQKANVQGLVAILTCIYGVDAVGILDKLPRNYISEKSMDNLLAKLSIATGGTWTKTFNENSGEWDFNYTPVANTNANINEESI